MLPCILKKDRTCILKYFAKKENIDDEAYLKYFPDREHIFTEENLLELKACIEQGELLPHKWAYKGKNKVCILDYYFGSGGEIIPIEGFKGQGGMMRFLAIDYPNSLPSPQDFTANPDSTYYQKLGE